MTRVKILKCDDYSDKEYERFRTLLSREKLNRIDKYRYVEDYRRSLLADVLARQMLSETVNIDASELDIRVDECGKPYAANASGYYFSVTHSGEYVACAVGDEPCGIDIEEVVDIELDIAKRFFSASEYNSLAEKTDDSWIPVFFEIWTIKEAYTKLVGLGLSMELNSFEVLKRNGKYSISNKENQEYHVTVKNLGTQYKLAIVCMNAEIEFETAETLF